MWLAAILLLIGPAAALAELPEVNMLGYDGATTVTSMSMTTGAYSGTSVVSGIPFTVQGTETGNQIVAVLTEVSDPTYQSTNDDGPLTIGADGHVTEPGSFHDTHGNSGSYTYEFTQPLGTVPSTTTLSCTPASPSYTCTATVTGAGGTPTGNITFSSPTPAGSFNGADQYVLSGGSCSVSYTPAGGASSFP